MTHDHIQRATNDHAVLVHMSVDAHTHIYIYINTHTLMIFSCTSFWMVLDGTSAVYDCAYRPLLNQQVFASLLSHGRLYRSNE